MSEEIRMPDLNSERVFRKIEETKVYLLKVTFNLRTLIFHAPKPGNFKKALRVYRRALKKNENADISALSDRKAAELVYQYYRYKGLSDVCMRANEEYEDYYYDLMSRLKKLKRVKSFAGWRMMSSRRKEKIYNDTKEINRILKKEYREDMNRLLFDRARVLGAKKNIIWDEYKKDPDKYTAGLDEYV